jgi:hypothetical protein
MTFVGIPPHTKEIDMTYFSKPTDLGTMHRAITNAMLCHSVDVIVKKYVAGKRIFSRKTPILKSFQMLGPADTKEVFEDIGYDPAVDDQSDYHFYYRASVVKRMKENSWLRDFTKFGPSITTVDLESGFSSTRFIIAEFHQNMDNWQARAMYWKLHYHGSDEIPCSDNFV